MMNLQVLNEISNEVERYNKRIAHKRDDMGYDVPVGDFIEGLLHTEEIFCGTGSYDEWGEEIGDYHIRLGFTNPRISKKTYSIYLTLMDKINYSDLVREVYNMIYDIILQDEVHYIHINYDHYRKESDYISKLVFIIDKRIKNGVLENSGLYYNPKWEVDNVPMYSNPLGAEIRLDEFNKNEFGDNLNHEYISTSDIVGQDEYSIEEDSSVDELLEKVGLTSRQKEYIHCWCMNNFNQTTTATELGIALRNSQSMIARIRERFDEYFNNKQVKIKKLSILELFDQLLDSDKVDENTISHFIKKNIDKDADFEYLVYRPLCHEEKSKMIKYCQGDESIYEYDLIKYIISLLRIYYEQK